MEKITQSEKKVVIKTAIELFVTMMLLSVFTEAGSCINGNCFSDDWVMFWGIISLPVYNIIVFFQTNIGWNPGMIGSLVSMWVSLAIEFLLLGTLLGLIIVGIRRLVYFVKNRLKK